MTREHVATADDGVWRPESYGFNWRATRRVEGRREVAMRLGEKLLWPFRSAAQTWCDRVNP